MVTFSVSLHLVWSSLGQPCCCRRRSFTLFMTECSVLCAYHIFLPIPLSIQVKLLTRQKCTHRQQAQGCRRGKGFISRLRLTHTPLHNTLIADKDLPFSTGNLAQGFVITYQGRESKKEEWIYMYVQLIHFVVQLRLTQHCKSIILQ